MAAEIDQGLPVRNPLFARCLDPWRGLRYVGFPMRKTPTPETPAKTGQPTATLSREERLKAALKANMGRRKAQARARSSGTPDDGQPDNENTGE